MSETYPWPDGHRAGLCVTFDFDGESPLLWRRRNDPPGEVAELEQRRYGPRRGVHTLLETLENTGVRATFFVPGTIAHTHRTAVAEIHAAGHELALHGWCHEPPTDLDAGELRDTLTRSADLLAEISGVRPTGYRSPSFRMSPEAFETLASLGLVYDSSVMGDDRPYLVGDLVEIPVDWATDDAVYYRYTGGGETRAPYGAGALYDAWRDELAGARAAGSLVNLTMHPWQSGRPARALRLRRLLAEAKEHGDVWIGTAGELAAHHRDRGVRAAGTLDVPLETLGWPL
ncbi:polysaccharide deacetylase family protein [Streptomyces sp. AD681]|uniref:polysaccharide deacetylase family protein n=1 Tax=Streptomyces sp. AD681 TaxID=3019069 RepID=UPI0022F1A2C1|nr:polysaccharide deacetylase family protein [Streptomyces sp. AD681]MDA5147038.1 polysaccharide deacetylase family protein [Streptomyces sp. AD681]